MTTIGPVMQGTPGMQRIWAGPARAGRSNDLAFTHGTRTVLAVDDEADALDMLRALFTAEGYRFVQASGGAQAISIVRDERPDLMIVDYMMPGMTGIELCEYLKAEPATSDIPIILYTAYAIPSRSEEKGLFDRAFTKPADFDELLRAVSSLLAPH